MGTVQELPPAQEVTGIAPVLELVGCPCCGEEMDGRNVVCWRCWRETNKLTPGTYVDTYTIAGSTFTITREDVERYERQRDARTGRLPDPRSYTCKTCHDRIPRDWYGNDEAYERDAATSGPCPVCFVGA